MHHAATPSLVAGLDFRPVLPVTDRPPELLDRPAVERAVRTYCGTIGASDSTTDAAVAWAQRNGLNTTQAVRIGQARANQLKARER